MLNITNIPAPRVPFIEERTGLISREWYRFLLNLFQLTGGGNNQTSLDDLQVGPDATTFVVVVEQSLESLRQQVETQAPDQMAELDQLIDIIRQELQTLPRAELGTISAQNSDNVNITGGLISGLRAPLPIASGGTNSTSTPTAGAVAYGTGTTYGFTAAGTSGQVLTSAGASVPTWTTPTTGTVTSVGLAMPTQFTVTNSPVTGSGTLTADWNTQTANYVLAGPTTGAAAVPTFRALVAADIPTLSYVTSVTGTSPVVSSGGATPAISLAAAYGDTLNPYASKTANFVLAAPNSLAGVPTFRALVAADVPGSALTKVDDTNVTLTLGGSPTTALLNAASLTLGWTGTLATARGGTGLSSFTANGVVYASSTSALTTGTGLTYDGTNAVLTTGSMTVGASALAGHNLYISRQMTGAASPYGVRSSGQIQTDATATAYYYRSVSAIIAGTTLTSVHHYNANQGTYSSTPTNQMGFFVESNLTGATNNYGFYSNIASGTGRWNFYAAGTADNYFAGNVGIGLSPTASVGAIQVSGGAFATSTVYVGAAGSTAFSGGIQNLSNSSRSISIEVDPTNAGANSILYVNIDGTAKATIDSSGNVLLVGAGGLGYGTGSGGAVTQLTSRTTGVTLNKTNGAITLFTAAGSATAATFTVTNSTVAATDVVHICQKSGTNLYDILVTAVAAGSFNVTFRTTGGTASDTPVFNFAVIKAVTA